jgi:asparagine synthetase B (glutamine-hydrolysing)
VTTVEPATQLGDFTIFGFTRDPERFLKHHLPARLGITPRSIKFGAVGHLFFYTSYGDVAESEEAIALKLGFVRSPTQSPLSTQQLLDQKIIGPGFVNNSAFRGNALVACFGKTEPIFSAFKTLIAVPQLYYSVSDMGIVCSDRLRCLVNTMDRVELNEDVLPMHFLFRSTPGAFTYFRNVQRLLPGQFFKWTDGRVNIRLLQDLHFVDDTLSFTRDEAPSLDVLYESLRDVVGDYVTQIETSGQSLANLLSGGVDSSLVQFLINEQSSRSPSRSFSFAARAPSFEFEIENARQASQLFHTVHTFVDFHPKDYAHLLTRTIDILAQPPILMTEPSMLAVAEFAQETGVPARFFFSGQGADTLFGLEGAKKLKGLNYLRRIPAAVSILRGLGTLLKPLTAHSRILLKGSEILACADKPHAFESPPNTIAVYVDLDTVRRCFGDQAVRAALEYRRDLEIQYLNSDHYLEKVYVIDLLTDTYELGVQRQQLFLAHNREQLHPFFDEDVLRVGFAFHPDERYIKGFRNKYLLKAILEQKTGSAAARKPKGSSVFEDDWYAWMRSGPLRPLVQDIQLPGFLSRADYEQLVRRPNYFLWGLLVFDVFQKRVLKG